MTAAAIHVELVEGPLPRLAEPIANDAGGAVLTFEGVVRPTEDQRVLTSLKYEAYAPMTERMLTELAERIIEKHGLHALACWHSVGEVPAHECSFRLQAVSSHRAETFAGMQEFIDRMKQDVPLWKVPVYADENTEEQT